MVGRVPDVIDFAACSRAFVFLGTAGVVAEILVRHWIRFIRSCLSFEEVQIPRSSLTTLRDPHTVNPDIFYTYHLICRYYFCVTKSWQTSSDKSLFKNGPTRNVFDKSRSIVCSTSVGLLWLNQSLLLRYANLLDRLCCLRLPLGRWSSTSQS